MLADRLNQIKEAIARAAEKSGRSPEDIKIVAVSKTKPAEMVREAASAGILVFGENRVQEAEQKISVLPGLQAEWHLIGHLQSNKAKKAVSIFDCIHSIDSSALIEKLNQEAEKQHRRIDCFLQVNISGEHSKSGVQPAGLDELISCVTNAPNLCCKGLMTIPPFSENPENARKYFIQLRELGEQCKTVLTGTSQPLELSMGMSNDFPIAVEEGATVVRIGTALFGERN